MPLGRCSPMPEFLLRVEPDGDAYVATCQPVKSITAEHWPLIAVTGDPIEGRASTFNGAMIAAMSQILLGPEVKS